MSGMKFVTDLGKGILGTADSTELWEEIVAHIPDSVLLKPGVKILIVACGHCTEADVIARRMLDLGLTSQQVQDSIYLLDKYRVFTNRAKRRGYKNVLTIDFMEWETDMKFDAVLGNPPYQNGNQGLWQDFVKRSINLLKDGGTLSFVTPNSWANGSNLGTEKNIFSSVFQKYNCTEIRTNVNSHFKGIGKNISQWTITKEPYAGTTRVIDKNGVSKDIDISKYPFFPNVFSFEALSIFEKILKHGSFYTEFVEKRTESNRYYAFPKIRHNAGYRKGYRYDDKDVGFPTSPVVVGFDCSKKTLSQVESIHSQFESALFKFLWEMYGANDAGSFGWILRNMPKLPDEKIYSNQDIYSFFGLTQEEIDYVEANVK